MTLRKRPRKSAAALSALQRTIGRRLRARRLRLGLSQESVAKACKLSPSYLSQLEAGLRNPTVAVLYRVGKVLGVTLFDLAHGERLGRVRNGLCVASPSWSTTGCRMSRCARRGRGAAPVTNAA